MNPENPGSDYECTRTDHASDSEQPGKVQWEADRIHSKMTPHDDCQNSVADNNCSLKCPEALIW